MLRFVVPLSFGLSIAVTLQSHLAAATPFDSIAPILARHCVRCHNDIDREGDFSLESEDSLAESGFVQPGDPDSHLLSVIRGSGDEPASMPKNADPLSPDQVAAIEAWIESGAQWPSEARIEDKVTGFDWWSFRPIERPEVPVHSDEWVRTPVDAFVLSRSEEKGVTHQPQADRRTLIRRLCFDLTGLPPTPEEVESFLHDNDPQAYENLVERLLDSKRYGERWARHWLDVVKYADTCGYDKDKLRANAWPYRDYVVRSFNQDKPYARFVQEQIAGDVLFPGHPDGILGLGFIAAGPWDFIGHVEVPESKIDGKVARNLDRDEMVTNTLNTFCSITVQCARCHHHKFDPFTQEHYYGLQAIFSAVDRAERPYDLDPEIEQRRRELKAELAKAKAERRAIEQEIKKAGGSRLKHLEQQIAVLAAKASLNKGPKFGYHSAIAKSNDVTKWVQIDLGGEMSVSEIVLHPCHDDFNDIGAGFGFPVRFRVDLFEQDQESPATSSRGGDFASDDFSNPGLSPVRIAVDAPNIRYVRVTATKLAARRNDYIFAMAEIEVLNERNENVALGKAVTSGDSIQAPPRWNRENLTDGEWAKYSDSTAADRLAASRRERSEILKAIETATRVERRARGNERIKALEKKLASIPAGKMVYAAATDFPTQSNFKPTGGKPRSIRLLHRGNVQQPRQTIGPRLLPLSEHYDGRIHAEASEGQRRARLAEWLTADDHPLVWRSIVNRVWQYHFGAGLVETPNDFGRMGALPTHPDLLDWLAVEFRDGGGSFKQLHRLIVTSSVYRQSSRFDDRNARVDGSNQYLWRMNRRRLEAEEIRDAILSVSGRLDLTMGGPGFYLFELEKTTHSPHFEYHKFDPADPASHRRSIYRFIARSQPDPFMTTLDCADSSQSTPRRSETLTSLQALSLLNNRFNLEMAERFAERLRSEADGLPSQVDHAMRLIAGRTATETERNQMVAYAEEHGLKNLCRMMFNLSEFVFLD